MGCGAVETQAPASKHYKASLSILVDLFPKITTNSPFLTEQAYTRFSSSLRQGQSPYILSVGARVDCSETVVAPVL